MDEEHKKLVAVFRFGVIADFVAGARLPRGDTRRLLAEKCARKWTIPFSDRTRIGRTTIRDWIARYEASGRQLEALYPKDRADSGRSRSINEDTPPPTWHSCASRCPGRPWPRSSKPWKNGAWSAREANWPTPVSGAF